MLGKSPSRCQASGQRGCCLRPTWNRQKAGRDRGAPGAPGLAFSPGLHPPLSSLLGQGYGSRCRVVGTAGSPLSSLSPGPARTEITTRSRSGPTGSQTRGSCGEAGGDPRWGDPRPGKGFTARFLQPRGCGREFNGRRLLRFLPPLPSRPGPQDPCPPPRLTSRSSQSGAGARSPLRL